MKPLVIVGILLFLIGATLMIVGKVTTKDTDPVIDIGKLEISKTTTETTRVPLIVSGGLMGVGAALAVIGALKKK